MQKLLIGGITIAVLVTGFVVATEAKKPKKEVVGLPELVVSPDVIYADKDNQVLMMLAAGKRLRKPQIQYRDSAGQWQDLGKLNDKGKDGDTAKGDKTYSLQTTIAQNGATAYRATARKGLRTLLVSPETKLAVRKGDWIVGYEIGDTGVTLDYPADMRADVGAHGVAFWSVPEEDVSFMVSMQQLDRAFGSLPEYVATFGNEPVTQGWLEYPVRVVDSIECYGETMVLCLKGDRLYDISNGYGMYGPPGSRGTTVPEEIFERILDSITFP